MASNYASDYHAEQLLELLYSIETVDNLISSLKVEVQALRLKLCFLRAIFSETGMWHVEDGNLKALLTRVQSVCSHVYMDLAQLWSDFARLRGRRFPITMDGLISSMLERIELLRPDIQEIYAILSISSRSVAATINISVMERLNSSMVDLLGCKADSIVSLKEELEAIQKGLRFLRNFLGFAASRSTNLGKLKDLLIHAEIVADNIACLLYLCCANDKMDDQMISWMKLELLSQIERIRPAQPEVRKIYINALKSLDSVACTVLIGKDFLGFLDSLRENLSELPENSASFGISVKDQMLVLHEDLRFLECLVVDLSSEEHADHAMKLKDLCKHNNILINEVACIIYSFYDDENEEMASERNSLVSDLLAKFKTAKEEARLIYNKLVPKSMRVNFPSTDAQGFINSLLGNMKQLLSSKADSITPIKHHIEAVLEELLSLKEDFCKIEKHHAEPEELEDQWTHFKNVAYQTEWVIDLFLAEGSEIWFCKLGLFDVIEEIKTIKTGLNHVRSKMADGSTVLRKFSSFPSQISLQISPKDELVIFEHESKRIMDHLTMGSKELHILSIVGMPGIGKTTLANSVFQHPSVTYHFHVRASCCISQAYDRVRLLVEILQNVTNQTRDVTIQTHGFSEEDLEHKLYQCLRGRRYLVFLDDIWDSKQLENMKRSFPDDKNGSRIMVTSRSDNIASQVGAKNVAYHLSPLSDEKSWEMLRFKLFGKETCPQDLVKVGKRIAISCSGLPLTIDLMAGILREVERKPDCWSELGRIWYPEFVDDPQGRCRKVLEMSYNRLPSHLRPCFLYFAAFPEDMQIRARRLRLLWISEGFVQLPENNEGCLEDVAQTYLDQLISRNLIMVSHRGSLGRVKVSHIHDLLRDFVTGKALEERFFRFPYDKLFFVDALPFDSILSSAGTAWYHQYRLCVYPDQKEEYFFATFSTSNPPFSCVRSLVCPSIKTDIMSSPEEKIFDHPTNFSRYFRILRVFDLEDIHIKHIFPSLLQLIHLRFLALKICEPKVFSEILHRLQNLETLKLKYWQGRVGNLRPKDIDNMARLRFLRHFEVPSFTFPSITQEIFEKQKPIRFDKLQHLSTPLLCFGEDHHEKLMSLMSNLRTLKCFTVSSRNPNSSLKLDFLKNLESLTIIGNTTSHTTIMPSFPAFLRRLNLTSLYLSWTNISELGKLEHLEVLKLRVLRSSTDRWDMEPFPKLKFLQLAYLDIREWNASVDDLPYLEQLRVIGCEGLEELPLCLAEVRTLQEINLKKCLYSALISARKIKEEQEELGNERLVVLVDEIIDEDPSRIEETNYEECLSALDCRAQYLSNEEVMMRGIWVEFKRRQEMNTGGSSKTEASEGSQGPCF